MTDLEHAILMTLLHLRNEGITSDKHPSSTVCAFLQRNLFPDVTRDDVSHAIRSLCDSGMIDRQRYSYFWINAKGEAFLNDARNLKSWTAIERQARKVFEPADESRILKATKWAAVYFWAKILLPVIPAVIAAWIFFQYIHKAEEQGVTEQPEQPTQSLPAVPVIHPPESSESVSDRKQRREHAIEPEVAPTHHDPQP